jgi:hypothetical protein
MQTTQPPEPVAADQLRLDPSGSGEEAEVRRAQS